MCRTKRKTAVPSAGGGRRYRCFLQAVFLPAGRGRGRIPGGRRRPDNVTAAAGRVPAGTAAGSVFTLRRPAGRHILTLAAGAFATFGASVFLTGRFGAAGILRLAVAAATAACTAAAAGPAAAAIRRQHQGCGGQGIDTHDSSPPFQYKLCAATVRGSSFLPVP